MDVAPTLGRTKASVAVATREVMVREMKVKDNIIISVELIVDEPKSDFNFMRLS
jgi:hypothetical protein